MKSTTNYLQTLFGSLALSLFACTLAPAQDEAPAEDDYEIKAYSARKYASAVLSSAFELDVLPPAPPTKEEVIEEPFEFKLVSITSNSGTYRATLVDKKGKYVVVTQKENKDTGFFLSEVQPSNNIQDVRVKVAKGGQSEWVEFDSARFKVASKTPAKAPTNTRKRPNIVPSNRKPTSTRKTTAGTSKSSSSAKDAIEKANAAAIEKAKSSSRSNGRRVVLPPSSRR